MPLAPCFASPPNLTYDDDFVDDDDDDDDDDDHCGSVEPGLAGQEASSRTRARSIWLRSTKGPSRRLDTKAFEVSAAKVAKLLVKALTVTLGGLTYLKVSIQKSLFFIAVCFVVTSLS